MPFRALRMLVSALLLATASVEAAGTSRLIQNLRAGKAQTVVVFGTSLTAGGAWVGGLRTWLDAAYPDLATVHNEAGSGQSSVWALRNIGKVTRHNPHAVIIEFAMNDAFYPPVPGQFQEGVPPETSRANLLRILDSLRAAVPGCEFVLQTMNLPLAKSRRYRPALETYYAGYRAVADSLGLLIADHEPVWKSVLDHDTSFYVSWVPDSLHPDADGSIAITLPGVIGTLVGAGVALTAPELRDTLSRGVAIPLRAEGVAPVTRVEFYLGNSRLGADSTAPYEFTWTNAPLGKHLLLARLIRGNTPAAVSLGHTVLVVPPLGIRVPQVIACKSRPEGPSLTDFRLDGRIRP